MAIKVVFPGRLPDAVLRGRCGKCGAVLECERQDLLTTQAGAPTSTVHCPTPECRATVNMTPYTGPHCRNQRS